jgi:hypothetical protein
MFKAIFRIITLTVFSVILIVALAVWKGGEPFIWVGKKTVVIGRALIEFGYAVDELKGKKRKIEKTYKELKEIIRTEEEEHKEGVKDEDTDKGRGSQ